MDYHVSPCAICSGHGSETQSNNEVSQDEVFIYLKRYVGKEAKLYLTTPHFRDFVRHVIQIAAYCFQQCRDEEGITEKVVVTVRKCLQGLPHLCEPMKDRLVRLMARTKMTNLIKLHNSELKFKKKCSLAEKNNQGGSKLKKLTHK